MCDVSRVPSPGLYWVLTRFGYVPNPICQYLVLVPTQANGYGPRINHNRTRPDLLDILGTADTIHLEGFF